MSHHEPIKVGSKMDPKSRDAYYGKKMPNAITKKLSSLLESLFSKKKKS
jgi:hypothetical protein